MSDKIETATEMAMRDAILHGTGVLLAGKRLPLDHFYRGVSATVERIKAAAEQFREDPRFRALVDSTVHEAMCQHGPVDPELPERDAHEIATIATALLLARIYDQDNELKTARAEAERYRLLAENAFAVAPPKPFAFSSAALKGEG